jgi:NAD(P)H-hydrate epimerase
MNKSIPHDPDYGLTLTRAQSREADRRAIEEFGIPGVVLMENAGRSATEIIQSVASGSRNVVILCGPGNNGGDGYVIARYLANAGLSVQIVLAMARERIRGDAAVHFGVVEKMGLEIVEAQDSPNLALAGIIVDALLGTGSAGDPRSPISELILQINKSRIPGSNVFAIDVPSGLDTDTGIPGSPTVVADHTVTFMASKTGFAAETARACLGQVHVVDIGIPPGIIKACSSGSQ